MEVERQGGVHLDDRCSSRTYKLIFDDGKAKEINVPGCGNESLFLVRYEPASHAKIYAYDKTKKNGCGKEITSKGDKGDGLAKVCAVDDMMDRWPRFSDIEI